MLLCELSGTLNTRTEYRAAFVTCPEQIDGYLCTFMPINADSTLFALVWLSVVLCSPTTQAIGDMLIHDRFTNLR